MALTMPPDASAIKGRVLLVSAPWPLFNRPSLPLGALKACMTASFPHLKVDASHVFLQVANKLGYERYQRISERVWRAESICAALLHPDRFQQAESLYQQTFIGKTKQPAHFKAVVRAVKQATDAWIGSLAGDDLDLIGFSVSFCQVTASLYLISQIKARHPELPVVVGGSSFAGGKPADLLALFPDIDYLVVGEGERPLAGLVHHLLAPRSDRPRSLPEGVYCLGAGAAHHRSLNQHKNLDDLPLPDYDDYFSLLNSFSPTNRFFATLPVEASRGCWWRRRDPTDRFRGCAFCNLNVQWKGYRSKSPDRVVREVDHLVRRHQVLSLAFSDNALPLNKTEQIFSGIRKLGRDLTIFAEVRAGMSPPVLASMRDAGVDTVQVGIEALSLRMLQKLNKGSRVIDNVNLMKHCEAAGIVNASNLMIHFPGSDDTDVRQTLATLDFVRWYRPLKTVRFWMGMESPVYRHARQFGIRCVYNHPNLKKLFPASIARGMDFMIQDYRGDRQKQRKLWRPVEQGVRQWRRDYETMQSQTHGKPALSLRDGGQFVMIDQHWPAQPPTRHRLTGTSAGIYRFCHVPRSIAAVAAGFPSHSQSQIEAFAADMVAKRLMFAEGDRYLSLAVPISW